MTYRLRVTGPTPATEGSPLGARLYWEMTEGTLEARGSRRVSRCRAVIGFRPGPDGFGRPDVRVQLVTDDGAIILPHYTGLVEANEQFKNAAETGRETRFEDHYMRMAMDFDTGAPRYAWLNQHLFIPEGRLTGKDQIEYRIYRVT